MSQAAIRQPIPIGKYFLDRKKITKKQLELALRHRQEFGLKLGQSLVELGLVTEADMIEALKHQARFPCVHLTFGLVDVGAARKLSEAHARRLNVVLLHTIADYGTVAMADPADVDVVAELAQLLGSRIFPVYSEPSAIRSMLDHVYGPAPVPLTKPAAACVPNPAPVRPAARAEAPAEAPPARKDGRPSITMAASTPAPEPRSRTVRPVRSSWWIGQPQP